MPFWWVSIGLNLQYFFEFVASNEFWRKHFRPNSILSGQIL